MILLRAEYKEFLCSSFIFLSFVDVTDYLQGPSRVQEVIFNFFLVLCCYSLSVPAERSAFVQLNMVHTLKECSYSFRVGRFCSGAKISTLIQPGYNEVYAVLICACILSCQNQQPDIFCDFIMNLSLDQVKLSESNIAIKPV